MSRIPKLSLLSFTKVRATLGASGVICAFAASACLSLPDETHDATGGVGASTGGASAAQGGAAHGGTKAAQGGSTQTATGGAMASGGDANSESGGAPAQTNGGVTSVSHGGSAAGGSASIASGGKAAGGTTSVANGGQASGGTASVANGGKAAGGTASAATGGQASGGAASAATGGQASGGAQSGGSANIAGMGASGGEGDEPSTGPDRRWANWKIPNSAGLPNPANDSDLGNGTVKDNVTGLMWQQVVGSTDMMSWDAARTYCENLVLGGYSDWRMPTRIELISLNDTAFCGNGGPCINPTLFPNPPSVVWYWSASVDHTDPTRHWIVWANEPRTFWDGSPGIITINKIVRCVRG